MLHHTIPEEVTAKRTDSLSEGCLWCGSGGGRAALGISETATGSPRWADEQLQSGEMRTALFFLFRDIFLYMIIYIYSHAHSLWTCCWPLRMDHHFIDFKLDSIQIKYPILFNSFNMRPIRTNIVFCSVGWFYPCFSGRDAGIDCLYSLGYCWGLSGAGGDGFMVPKFHQVVWCQDCWFDVLVNIEYFLDIIEQWYIDRYTQFYMHVCSLFCVALKSPCPPVFTHYSRFTSWCVPWCIISKDNIKTYGESLAQAWSVRTGRIRYRHGLKFGCFERIFLNGLNLEVLQFLGHPRKKNCVKHWMTRDLVCNTMTLKDGCMQHPFGLL